MLDAMTRLVHNIVAEEGQSELSKVTLASSVGLLMNLEKQFSDFRWLHVTTLINEFDQFGEVACVVDQVACVAASFEARALLVIVQSCEPSLQRANVLSWDYSLVIAARLAQKNTCLELILPVAKASRQFGYILVFFRR